METLTRSIFYLSFTCIFLPFLTLCCLLYFSLNTNRFVVLSMWYFIGDVYRIFFVFTQNCITLEICIIKLSSMLLDFLIKNQRSTNSRHRFAWWIRIFKLNIQVNYVYLKSIWGWLFDFLFCFFSETQSSRVLIWIFNIV